MTVETPATGDREAIRELKALARAGDQWSVLAPLARLLESTEVAYTRATTLHVILKAARTRAQELGHEPPGSKLRASSASTSRPKGTVSSATTTSAWASRRCLRVRATRRA